MRGRDRFYGCGILSNGEILSVEYTYEESGDGITSPVEHEYYAHEYSINGIIVDEIDLPDEIDKEFLNAIYSTSKIVPDFSISDISWDD